MIDIRLDPASSVPLSEQVRAQIAAAVARGALPVGERLPSVRGLAAELALAPGTVAKVYQDLAAEGIVETAGRAGTRVAGGQDAEPAARLAQAAADLVARARRAGHDDAAITAAVRAALGR